MAIANQQAVLAARSAIAAHTLALGIDGDTECQMWHLLVSLHEFCGTTRLDFDRILAEAKEGIASGELSIPAWEEFKAARDKPVPVYPGSTEY